MLNLLYYKNILDISFVRFINDNNSMFTREGDNYVLGKSYGYSQLKKIFKTYIIEELGKYVTSFDITRQNYYFIIGACNPKNNILLKFKDDKYFPEKLTRLINCEYPIKYYLKEKDIIVNNIRINQVMIDIFNEMFRNQDNIRKMLGSGYDNVFFVQHKNLDCYSMFKIIKNLYGKSSCFNIHKEMMSDIRHPIVAINEMICKYIGNKRELLKSDEFNDYKSEIRKYINDCMRKCLEKT